MKRVEKHSSFRKCFDGIRVWGWMLMSIRVFVDVRHAALCPAAIRRAIR